MNSTSALLSVFGLIADLCGAACLYAQLRQAQIESLFEPVILEYRKHIERIKSELGEEDYLRPAVRGENFHEVTMAKIMRRFGFRRSPFPKSWDNDIKTYAWLAVRDPAQWSKALDDNAVFMSGIRLGHYHFRAANFGIMLFAVGFLLQTIAFLIVP